MAYTFDDSAKQQALYVDGIQVAVGAASGSIGYDDQSLFLGRDTESTFPNFWLSGLIDEAAIYNRALSPSESRCDLQRRACGQAAEHGPILIIAIRSSRDQMIFLVMLHSGLREEGVSNLTWKPYI